MLSKLWLIQEYGKNTGAVNTQLCFFCFSLACNTDLGFIHNAAYFQEFICICVLTSYHYHIYYNCV